LELHLLHVCPLSLFGRRVGRLAPCQKPQTVRTDRLHSRGTHPVHLQRTTETQWRCIVAPGPQGFRSLAYIRLRRFPLPCGHGHPVGSGPGTFSPFNFNVTYCFIDNF